MIARRNVWSNPEIQQLLKGFVVSADEVWRLQNGKDPECLLAQKVFEQGHYAGRTQPTNTRQGTYATAPSGALLASINTTDAGEMASMLRRALAKWNAMPTSERLLRTDPAGQKASIVRAESRYPQGGLVLRIFSRDLPRAARPGDWRADAWNQDYAWFTKDEVRSMLPADLSAGKKTEVPAALIRRLARFNFVDNVRGQTGQYREEDIVTALLETEVVRVAGGVATVRFRGTTKAERVGTWAVAGFRDMNSPTQQRLSMSLKLYGTGTYSADQGKFMSFEMIALGTRSGATQYNGRYDDLGAAPVGYFLGLAGSSAAEKVAPANFGSYGWR
ncbi:MAG: hypothetical protein WAO58_08945 [Fimbriimonadaceae bacterium]